jgi:hypothetical protein
VHDELKGAAEVNLSTSETAAIVPENNNFFFLHGAILSALSKSEADTK